MSETPSPLKRLLTLISMAATIPTGASLSQSQCIWRPASRFDRTLQQCLPLVDDKTTAVNTVWAYNPHCMYPGNENDGQKKFCIYTYITPDGQAGVSLVAQPEKAAFAAAILASNPGPWGTTAPYHNAVSACKKWYDVKELPGKGKGLVATRTIPAGMVIVDEFPYLIGFASGAPGIAREANPEMLHLALYRLPLSHHDTINALARTTGGEELEDAFRTNSYGVNIDGMEISAMFPEIARINHGCRPNSFTRFSRTTLRVEIVTYRDIKEGEEITVSYFPQNLPSKQRKELISRRGFKCTCDVCSSPDQETISDKNRQRIQDILITFRDLEKRTADNIRRASSELFEILEKESMQVQQGEFAALFADLYWEIGEKEMARDMARLSTEKRIWYNGADSERAEKASKFLQKFG